MKGSFKVKGYVHQVEQTQEFTKFRKREFILRMERRHNKMDFIDHIKFQLTRDKCEMIDQFSMEEYVEVEFFIRGRMWKNQEGKEINFTTLEVWNINPATGRKKSGDPEKAIVTEKEPEYQDDLPF